MKIYLSSKGLKPSSDNSGIINRQLEIAKEGSTIVWPEGKYQIASPIMQAKTLHWEGSEETIIEAQHPMTFAVFSRGYKSVISRIKFEGYHSVRDVKDPTFDAVIVNSLVNMRDCKIMNAWGNGITVQASLPLNASKCKFENIDIGQCKGNGMYFQGGDANQCSSYDMDIRDCDGIGIWDNSFLGNNFFSCMTHANRGGSYKAGDEKDLANQNSRSGFFGCYAEGDQGPVILCGHSRWYGGLAARGITVYNFAKYETD